MKLANWILAAAAALAVAAALEAGVGDARAEPSWRCSQIYFRAHQACIKRASPDECSRTIGTRMSACMQTGCWRVGGRERCGIVRL